METEELFLFTDAEMGIPQSLEIKVGLRGYSRAIERKKKARKKVKATKKTIKILDDETCSPSLISIETEDDKFLAEEKYGVPEEFLIEMEKGCVSELGDKLMIHDLLKKDDEKRLLNAFCETRDNPALAWLSRRIKSILICRNMRLIGNLVQKKFTNYIGQGVERDDIVQYGVEGLARAIQKFDMSKQCCLSTYATRWIVQAIQRSLDNESDIIRNPVHYHNYWGRISKAEDDYITETQSDEKPSEEYICKKARISKQMYHYVTESATCSTYLDAPVDSSDDKSTDFSSVMADERQDVEGQAEENIRKEAVLRAIRSLPKMQAAVIRIKFGFQQPDTDKDEISYTDIARKLGVRIDDVRDAEQAAMSTLRSVLFHLADDAG